MAICPNCHGCGFQFAPPCAGCNNTGIISCCDTAGAQASGTSYLTLDDLRLTDAIDRAGEALKDDLDDFIPVPEGSPWYVRER